MSYKTKVFTAYTLLGLAGAGLSYVGEAGTMPASERNGGNPAPLVISQDIGSTLDYVLEHGPAVIRAATDENARTVSMPIAAGGEAVLLCSLLGMGAAALQKKED
ncbi:MAG: hypothetical protein H6502_03000 [Candidatus Woesearchaeota archaeon]|nr:MAG: hypothetical protein H6502_03000 [Candidatus Woesearchaeota archaeon]